VPANDSNTSRQLEVERKFDVAESTPSPSFEGVDAIVRVGQAETEMLDAVYFDTAAKDLASHRITLRRRTGGGDAGWHLKLPAGTDARTEVRAPLTAALDPPVELLEAVRTILRGQPVSPVARIRNTREFRLLYGVDGVAVAEFCDDHVTAGKGVDGSTATQRWREWELEIVDAAVDAELMDRLCSRLLDAGAQPAGHGSKLARVLGT
jgi:hypothetical protein